jgi:hypothetical protein
VYWNSSAIGVSLSTASRKVVSAYSTVAEPLMSRSPGSGLLLRPPPPPLNRSVRRLLLIAPTRRGSRDRRRHRASAVVVGAVSVPVLIDQLPKW